MQNALVWMRKRHYIVALIIAVCIALAAVSYSQTLYSWIDGDEIVVLEAEKAKSDMTYPDRDMVALMGYKTYAYPKIVSFLNQTFTIPEYNKILLFFIVFSTIFCSYAALHWLGFSSFVSMGVAIVGIMPRFGPVGEKFGALTPYEVSGRCLIVPLFWILAAWYIKRYAARKLVFPVFLALGLGSYLHPATAIMFFVLLVSVHLFRKISEKELVKAMKETAYNAAAFGAGAFFLLQEIFTRTASIAAPVTDRIISSAEYVGALMYRIPWEYPPDSLMWLRHVLIVSAFFIVCTAYALYLIRKGRIDRQDIRYQIVLWGAWVMAVAFVVHISVPNIQLYLMERYDAPLIFWQFGRIFKFFYLALLLIFAVVLSDVVSKYGKEWALPLIVIGIMSSSFFFEWGQFLIGFKNYQKEYIPVSLQRAVPKDQYLLYGRICSAFSELGSKNGDIVLADDFNLRYFCGLRPHITFEEGTARIFMGQSSLVDWHSEMRNQGSILQGGDASSVRSYAIKNDATFAILPASSTASVTFSKEKRPIRYFNEWAIIRLKP